MKQKNIPGRCDAEPACTSTCAISKVGDRGLYKSGTVHSNTSLKWFRQFMDVFRMVDPVEGTAAASILKVVT